MCVVSNLGYYYGHRRDGWPWQPYVPTIPLIPAAPTDFTKRLAEIARDHDISDLKQRIEALEKMLREAKKFDAETGQPDCEMDEKVELLKRLAKDLGVEINIP